MTIQILLHKIRENIKSLNHEDEQVALILLKDILKKIHSLGFQYIEVAEFEFINTLFKAAIDKKTNLFEDALTAVVSDLAKCDNEGKLLTPPPSADWSSFRSPIELEKLYAIFTDAFKKQLSIEHIIKKASNNGCESFTSCEFDFIQAYINTGITPHEKYDKQRIKRALIENYNGMEGLKQQFEDNLLKQPLPIKFRHWKARNPKIFGEIWNRIWTKELFEMSCNRLQLIGIINEQSKAATSSAVATSKPSPIVLNTPEQFFDLLFHQYTPPKTGPFVATTLPRDHRALFIALVLEATKSKQNKSDFFSTIENELKKQFELNVGEELTNQHIPDEVQSSYNNIYDIFDEDINNPINAAIIQQLTKYEPTKAGYDNARAEFLRIYNSQTSSITASADSSAKYRESSTSAISTQRNSNKTDKQLTNTAKKHLPKESTEQSEQKEREKLIAQALTASALLIKTALESQSKIEEAKAKATTTAIARAKTIASQIIKKAENHINKLMRKAIIHAQHMKTETTLESKDPKILAEKDQAINNAIQGIKNAGREIKRSARGAAESFESEMMEKIEQAAGSEASLQNTIPIINEEGEKKVTGTLQRVNEGMEKQVTTILKKMLGAFLKINVKMEGMQRAQFDMQALTETKKIVDICAVVKTEIQGREKLQAQAKNAMSDAKEIMEKTRATSVEMQSKTEEGAEEQEQQQQQEKEEEQEQENEVEDNTLDSSLRSNSAPEQLGLSAATATIINSAELSDHKITSKIVLNSLWGDMNRSDPAADSACGKALAAWNKKQPHSPTMFSPPKFKFNKPNESDIAINNNGNNIEINLTAIDRSNNQINLNLSRSVDHKKNKVTWVCQSDNDSINEIKQFELIAAESLALRKAQGVKNAEKIGIVDIGENDVDKKQSAKFNLRLSDREEALIEAHFRVGYTEITYGSDVLTNTPDDEHADMLTPSTM